jgi:hypothetical protein
MAWISFLIILPFSLLIWAELDPNSLRTAANALRLWWREIAIRQYGKEHVHTVHKDFYRIAKRKGLSHTQAKAALKQCEQELINAVGEAYIKAHKPWLDREI